MSKLDDLTTRTLASVDPTLAHQVRRVLASMAALGFPMCAYDGKRTSEQQRALYAKGRTLPGPIVTHLDGVRKKSKHQAGLAVDCAFMGSDLISLDWNGPWDAYGTAAEACDLLWGGRWTGLRDRPHVEMRG